MDKRINLGRFTLVALAVGISLVYLLSPVQKQVFGLLHEVSHVLTALHQHGHPEHGDHEEHDHDSHTHSPTTQHVAQTKAEHHEHARADHEHRLLAGAQRLLLAKEDATPYEKTFFEVKLDKHFNNEELLVFPSFTMSTDLKTGLLPQEVCGAFVEVNGPPPDPRSI